MDDILFPLTAEQANSLISGQDCPLHSHSFDRQVTREQVLQYQDGEVVKTYTTSKTLSYSDDIVLGNSTSGALNFTLPPARGGKRLTITRIAGSNNITLLPTSPDLINGAASKVISTSYAPLSFKAVSGVGFLTRASIGTYYNISGTLVTAAVDVPRNNYDPVSHAPLGVLIEKASQNLLQYSQDCTNAAWTKANIGTTVISGTAPDSTATANLISDTDATAAYILYQGQNVPNNSQAYIHSIYIKAGTAPDSVFGATCQTGGTTISNYVTILWTGGVPSITAGTGTLLSVGSGWYRLSIPITNNNTGNTQTYLIIYPRVTVPSYTGSVYVWGAQIERGTLTSYIPTTSAQVTREADIITGWVQV